MSANENTMLAERTSLVAMRDKCEERIQEIDNQIKATMGENEKAVGANFTVKWSNTSKTTIDSKRLKAELPEIYKEYANTTNGRRFTVKEID